MKHMIVAEYGTFSGERIGNRCIRCKQIDPESEGECKGPLSIIDVFRREPKDDNG